MRGIDPHENLAELTYGPPANRLWNYADLTETTHHDATA